MSRIQFIYKNHRGEVALRTVEPVSLDYIPTPNPDYGYGPGWFLHCKDYTDGRNGISRSFALSNIQMDTFDVTKNVAFRIKLQ